MRATLLALAAVLVALAIGVASGNYTPGALALVLAGTALAAAAHRAGPPDGGAFRPAELVLLAGVSAGLLWNAAWAPCWFADHDRLPGFRPLLGLAGLLVATHPWPRLPSPVGRLRFPVLAALWLALVALVLHAVPSPRIDVWDLQQGGVRALLAGRNPYAEAYPNTYGPGTPLLAKAVLSGDGRFILAYPYPPLTLLAGAAAAGLGDVRWAFVALTLLSAVGVLRLGRGTRLAELAATFVLFQPRTFLVMEQAWTEPLVLATLVGLAHASDRAARTPYALAEPVAVRLEPAEGRTRAVPLLLAGLAAGLGLASKQYAPILLVPFLPAVPAHRRWHVAAGAAAVGAALYLPFLLIDPAALWRSLVTFHVVQPFRRDSLSLAAALFRSTGLQLPAWPGFLAAAAVLAAGWRRIRGSSDALAVGSLAWLALLLLAKQAFANYYWLATGVLCAAVAAGAGKAAAARSRDMETR